jgi:7-cyano-7-deazaguanine synthase
LASVCSLRPDVATMEKVVVLLSGGIDSSVAAAYLKSAGFEVSPLFIDHHQGPLEAERRASRIVSSKLGLTPPFKAEVDLMKFKQLSKKWLERPQIGTPGRNMVFASMAVVYAGIVEAENIALATAFGSTFADTSLGFLESLQNTAQIALDRPIRIFSPFKTEKWTDEDIVKHGSNLGVPLEETWSCYMPNRRIQCGICPKCRYRKNRFSGAGVRDRTKYDSRKVPKRQLKEALFYV